MPGTITTDFTTIDAADAATDWLTLGTIAAGPTANSDMAIQGTNALANRISAAAGPVTQEAYLLAANAGTPGSFDLTINQRHIYIWVKDITWPAANTRANGGMRVSISSDATPTLTGTSPLDGPTNSKTWFVDGNDTETIAGWICYVVDPQSAADLVIGSISLTASKRVGMGTSTIHVVGAGSFKPDNIIVDLTKYGSGLTINNGTSAAPVGFIDIFTADSSNANAYGVLTSLNGVYFGAGKFNFGTSGQSAITFFKDTNQVLVFQPFLVANSFYAVVTAGAASFNTTFQLGTFSNNVASGGCTIQGAVGIGIGAPGAPTGAAAAGSGLGIGNYLYKITFVTSVGETNGGTESATVTTTSGNQKVSLTAIPTYATTSRVTARNIYRTKVGGASGTELFVATISDNTTTTFTDSTADSALGRPVPTVDTTVSSAWTLTANAANTTTNLYGCNLSQMRPSSLNSSSAMQSCVVSGSGEITTNGATINKCTFTNVQQQAPVGGTWALIFSATSDATAVTNCNFINCNKAIKITTAGTYTFSGLTFAGNNFDVENASTGAVTINATNGSNVSTFTNTNGGTTTINNAVTLTVTCQDILGNLLQNIRVAIYKSNDLTGGHELLQSLTNASGVATASFAFLGNQSIIVRVRGETPAISTPVNGSFTSNNTGGSLSNGTFFYRISATNDIGETLASTETSITLSGGTSTQEVVLNWNTVTDATGYKIYGRTSGAELFISSVGAVTTFTDTGSITPSGALPSSNTTQGGRYVPIDASGTITSNGYTALFTLIADSVASTSAL